MLHKSEFDDFGHKFPHDSKGHVPVHGDQWRAMQFDHADMDPHQEVTVLRSEIAGRRPVADVQQRSVQRGATVECSTSIKLSNENNGEARNDRSHND